MTLSGAAQERRSSALASVRPGKSLVEHERQDEADNGGDADADEGVDRGLSQDLRQIGIVGKLAEIRQRPE